MTRIMYDSTNPLDIPATAKMVAGYIDGTSFKWPESAWTRFPNATKVRIARRTSTNDGHVLDVEANIPTVWPLSDVIVRQGIRNWVNMRRASGVEPTIYCNQLNDWPAVRNIFTSMAMREPNYWVARYDGEQDIPAGAVAKQFANPTLSEGHYDLSIVADNWPGVDTGDNMSLTDAQNETLNAISYRLKAFLDVANAVPGGPNNPVPGEEVPMVDMLDDMSAIVKDVGARLERVESMLDLLVGDGVSITADGVITIGYKPVPPVE